MFEVKNISLVAESKSQEVSRKLSIFVEEQFLIKGKKHIYDLYIGSSTLCLFALDKQENTLTSLNIGDSGFVIYRNNEIHGRSKCTMNSSGVGPRQLFAVNGSLGLPCFINEKLVKQRRSH